MAQYTKVELESALQRANSDPVTNAKIIEEITGMLASGRYIEEGPEDEVGGSLIYDKLNEDESYNEALRNFYGRLTPSPKNEFGPPTPSLGNISKSFTNMSTLSNWQDINFDDSGNLTHTSEELKEKSFELFNSAMLNEVNLFRFGNEISKMSKDERDNLAKLYDVWERTKITGEGSRPLWEQAKDAAHVLYAPTTYVGGKIITAPMMKAGFGAAMKQMLKVGASKLTDPEKEILRQGRKQIARRSGTVGAAIMGPYDVAQQTQVEMQLRPDQEYSPGRTAAMTGLGYGFGWALSKAPRTIGKVLRAPGVLLNKAAPNVLKGVVHPFHTTGSAFMKAFGGGPAARTHVSTEGEKIFGADSHLLSSSGHGENLQQQVKSAVKQGYDNFSDAFSALGELNIKFGSTKSYNFNKDVALLGDDTNSFGIPNVGTKTSIDKSRQSIFNLIEYINDQVPPWNGLKNIITLLERGQITPTKALREIRSKVGAATNDNNINIRDFRDVFRRLDTEVREVMSAAAKRSGKSKEFAAVDSHYSKFKKAVGHKELQKLMQQDSSDTVKKLNTLTASSKNNVALLNEHNARLDKLSNYAFTRTDDVLDEFGNIIRLGDPVANDSLVPANEAALRGVLGDQMFKNTGGSGFKLYLGHKEGRDALKKIFPGRDATIDRLSKILQNASNKGGVGMYAMRLLTVAGAGVFGFKGQIANLLMTSGAYVGIELLLRSPWYGKQAARVFSKDPTKSAAEAMKLTDMLGKRGYTPEAVNKIMNLMLGSAVWAGILADKDRREVIAKTPPFLGELILDNKLAEGAIGGIQEFGSTIDKKVFQPVFDTVTEKLISEQQE